MLNEYNEKINNISSVYDVFRKYEKSMPINTSNIDQIEKMTPIYSQTPKATSKEVIGSQFLEKLETEKTTIR